ncbi:eukaryotic translation initiation factor 4G [Trifolium repens]|nr:eukaryotic translation initiation factor 4G [Trifolium repens]
MNFSSFRDLIGAGGRKVCNCKLELLWISVKKASPFSVCITSKVLPRTSAASPICKRLSPPLCINRPIASKETTCSVIALAKMRPRNSGAFGASVTPSSKVFKTDSNLAKINRDEQQFQFF